MSPQTKAPSAEHALHELRKEGVVVFPGLFAAHAGVLLEEHRRALDDGLAGIHAAAPLDGERIVSTRIEDLHRHGLSNIAGALESDLFRLLAQHYLHLPSRPAVPFASLAYDTPKQDPEGPGNQHKHWDPTLSLRLMLYVTDVSRDNGAIEIIRGTHMDNHATRLKYWRQELPYSEKVPCAGSENDFDIVEGPAGTVLIFDVSITHRRGLVSPGRHRRVAFGHIHSPLAMQQFAGDRLEAIPPEQHWPHRMNPHD